MYYLSDFSFIDPINSKIFIRLKINLEENFIVEQIRRTTMIKIESEINHR